MGTIHFTAAPAKLKNVYGKVASSNKSRFEAYACLFRLSMKGIFDPYILWPFGKNFIFELVALVRTCDSTVNVELDFFWCQLCFCSFLLDKYREQNKFKTGFIFLEYRNIYWKVSDCGNINLIKFHVREDSKAALIHPPYRIDNVELMEVIACL